nr:TrkA family potassium uptake protein [Ligilactobacillus equi]
MGQFGTAICESLLEAGQDVLIVDHNEEVINDFAGKVLRAVIADAEDEEALRDLSIGDFDHVYISIGRNVEASIMATLIVKELGAKHIISRAENERHAKVLDRIGADLVVRPEKDIAERIVYQQLHPNITNYLQLSKMLTLADVVVRNKDFFYKTLEQLDLTNRFGVNVILIISRDEKRVNQRPHAQDVIHPYDRITVVGRIENIERLEEYLKKGK